MSKCVFCGVEGLHATPSTCMHALSEHLDVGSACCTSRYRELAHENMALAERLAKVEASNEDIGKRLYVAELDIYVAELDIKETSLRTDKVEAAQHSATNRFRPTFEELLAKVGPLPTTALASAEGFVRCSNGTCVDRAGHEGPCTPRREAKVASAEGRPVWEPVCAHDVSLKERCAACYEEVRDCIQECCGVSGPLNPAQPREAAKDTPEHPCDCRVCTQWDAPQSEAPAGYTFITGPATTASPFAPLPAEPASDAGAPAHPPESNATYPRVDCRIRPGRTCHHGACQIPMATRMKAQPAASAPARRPPPISDEERAKRAPTVHPAVMMDAGGPSDAGQACGRCNGRGCVHCESHDIDGTAPSEPAKAPLINQVCPCDCCQGKINADRCLRRTDFVRDLEARLSNSEREHGAVLDDLHREQRKLAEAEKARDGWREQSDRWQRNFDESAKREHALREELNHERATCLSDERAKAEVLAERARCWSAVDTCVANIETRRHLDEAINGIASGAQPPAGVT